MKKLLSVSIFCFFLLVLPGCTEDPVNPVSETTEEQSITAKIDGRDFKAVMPVEQDPEAESIVTNLIIYPNESGFVLGITGVDGSWEDAAAVDVRVILIGPDLSSLTAGTVFENRITDTEPTFDGYVAAGLSTMLLPSLENAYIALTDDFGTIKAEITSIDHEAKRISGTFEFTAVDPDEGKTVVVTEGEFKNIHW
ncbi:DUF6252 family protein [Cyclobacterium plantarum]|uniref:DUF6252 family protein n=1 Tax=Cyclobacterium plantarum TaxID=2716263 RepID=UPI003F7105A0